jgi:hypothetical protein
LVGLTAETERAQEKDSVSFKTHSPNNNSNNNSNSKTQAQNGRRDKGGIIHIFIFYVGRFLNVVVGKKKKIKKVAKKKNNLLSRSCVVKKVAMWGGVGRWRFSVES